MDILSEINNSFVENGTEGSDRGTWFDVIAVTISLYIPVVVDSNQLMAHVSGCIHVSQIRSSSHFIFGRVASFRLSTQAPNGSKVRYATSVKMRSPTTKNKEGVTTEWLKRTSNQGHRSLVLDIDEVRNALATIWCVLRSALLYRPFMLHKKLELQLERSYRNKL